MVLLVIFGVFVLVSVLGLLSLGRREELEDENEAPVTQREVDEFEASIHQRPVSDPNPEKSQTILPWWMWWR